MSTRQGMRKILKRSLGPYHHIKKKYEAGLFDGEYPFSYEVMQLEPPFPMPVGVMSDVKYEPHKGKIVLPTDPLVKQYIRRNGTKAAKDYYDRPTQQVGIGDYESYIQSASSSENKHRLMKGTVSEAYYFASRQYEYMQKHWADIDKEDGMTEDEIVANVEKLLEEEAKEERFNSRQTAKDIQTERNEKDAAASAASESNVESSTAETEESSASATTSAVAVASSNEDKTKNVLDGLPTMLHGKPKVILQMTMWNERLKQTPYKYWTVGAATALDHWIALEILDLTEQTWQTVLERNATPSIRGIANDIVTVRNALFPETLEDYHDDDEDDDDDIGTDGKTDDDDDFLGTFSSGDAIPKNSTDEDDTEKNIDELLKSLGVPDEDVLDQDEFWNTAKTGGDGSDGEDEDGDDDKDQDTSTFDQHAFETNTSKADQLSRLRLELNQWQKKNHELLFDKWPETEQEEFNTWLRNYVKVITEDVETNTPNTTEISEPDFKATRDAIFNEPYVPYDQDELMWMAMSEDTEAELVLKQLLESRDELLQQGVLTPEEYQQWQHFEQLSYRDQLKQLRSIDAMRTITGTGNVPSGSAPAAGVGHETMQSFATNHMEFLRQGVEMNELTPDLEGAITSKTISNELPNDEHLFSYKTNTLEGADQAKLEHDSDLHTEWGRFKSNVANHEESLYEQGRMGIDKRTKSNDKKSKKKKKDDFDM